MEKFDNAPRLNPEILKEQEQKKVIQEIKAECDVYKKEVITWQNASMLSPEQLASNQKMITEVTQQISGNPAYQDMPHSQLLHLLQQGEYMEVFKLGFDILWKSIFSQKEGEIWFPQFHDLDQREKVIDQKSHVELKELLISFDAQIAQERPIKEKIAFTKVISMLKDKIYQHEHPWSLGKKQILEDKLMKELEVGSIILMNKQESWIGWRLLKNLDSNDIDMTHILVVTDKWPPPLFSHSTQNKVSNWWGSGVENDVHLIDYIGQFPWDYVILQPESCNQKQLLSAVEKLKNASYSSTDALMGALGKRELKKVGTESYNCGSYVAEVLGFGSEMDQDLAVPSNWLGVKGMKPRYLFTQSEKF